MPRLIKTRTWVQVLDRHEQPLNTGAVLVAGELDLSIHTAVRGGGRIDILGELDLLQTRFQPWRSLTVDGVTTEWPLGIYVPTTPESQWSGRGRSRSVTVQDKLRLLDRARVAEAYTLTAGTNVTTAIQDLVEYATGQAVTIEQLPDVLRTDVVWEPGETVLRICNDLCDAINAFALTCDGWGRFQVTPYVEPVARPIVAEFVHGENATFVEPFTETLDLDSVVNHVAVSSEGTDDTPTLTAEASNDEPDDPLSTVNRGVVSADPETVETTSQAVLDAYAARRLTDRGSVTRTVEITHVPMDLPLNGAVKFVYPPAGVDGRFVVQKTQLPLADTGLQVTTLREVAG